MSCGSAVKNEGGRRKQEEALKEAMEYVMREEDDVECSVCEVWTTCGKLELMA